MVSGQSVSYEIRMTCNHNSFLVNKSCTTLFSYNCVYGKRGMHVTTQKRIMIMFHPICIYTTMMMTENNICTQHHIVKLYVRLCLIL